MPRVESSASGSIIEVQLLHSFAVAIDGAAMPAAAWRLKHPRSLFQMLCLKAGHQLHRDEAADALWPGSDTKAAHNRLYHTVHVLRTEFARHGLADSEPVLTFQSGTLQLNPRHRFEIDRLAFGTALARCQQMGETVDLASLEAALAFLAGWHETRAEDESDWLTSLRNDLRTGHVWLLERLADRLRDANRPDEAASALQQLVAIEPANEPAHRALMSLFAAAGQAEKAMLQYASCKRHLQRELAASPAADTELLRETVVAHARGRQTPGAGASAPMNLLSTVAPHDPLIGRGAECTQLLTWFADDATRLVTVAAPAGTGKTRLAQAVAQTLQTRRRDGALWVSLSELMDANRLEMRLCEALGIEVGAGTHGAALRAHLANKELLLVLDRFEHLVEAAPRLSDLIEAAPGLQVLVASQRVLRCRFERVFELRQLGVSSPTAAIELMQRRAEAVGVRIESAADRDLAAQLCRRLDGNALAIELAAAQFRCRSLAELARDLAFPLDMARADSPEPQARSLRHAVDWSISRLDAKARDLLWAIGVFERTFDLDDLLSVVGTGSGEGAVRVSLQTLLDSGLLSRDARTSGDSSPPRFQMLDFVRRFVREPANDRPQRLLLDAAHARWFRRRAHEADALERTGHGVAAYAIFERIEPDLERGLDWWAASGDRQGYLQTCFEACLLQFSHGRFKAAIARLRSAVELAANTVAESRYSAWCAFTLSRALHVVDDLRGAVSAIRLARRRARNAADDFLDEKVATQLTALRWVQLNPRAAALHIDALMRRFDRKYAPSGSPSLFAVASSVRQLQGDYAGALKFAEASLDAALDRNNLGDVRLAQQTLLGVTLRTGHMARAHEHARECRAIEIVGPSGASLMYRQFHYFHLHFESAEYQPARESLLHLRNLPVASQLPCAREIDIALDFILIETGRASEAVSLLAPISLTNGHFNPLYMQLHAYRLPIQVRNGATLAALDSLAAALHLARRTRNPLWISWLVESCAHVAIDRGQPAAALVLIARAELLQRQASILPSPRQRASWSAASASARALAEAGGTNSIEMFRAGSTWQLLTALEAWSRIAVAAPGVLVAETH